MITAAQLSAGTGAPILRASAWLPHIVAALAAHEIATPGRIAAFLAQIGHESGGLLYTREIWGPTAQQTRYEGRADLGNTRQGDGLRFRGRGLIQITGRANYRTAGAALGLPLEDRPQLLEEMPAAAMSAAWFWRAHGLNALADEGDMSTITRCINGGTNGLENRLALYQLAQESLGIIQPWSKK